MGPFAIQHGPLAFIIWDANQLDVAPIQHHRFVIDPVRDFNRFVAWIETRVRDGMTVVEALPGQGWYSRILVAYLGKEGHLIGVDYPADMWPRFDWASKEFIEGRTKWPAG